MSKRPYVSSRPEDGNPLRYWYIDRLIALSADLPVIQVNIHDLGELDRVAWYGSSAHQGRLTVRQAVDHFRRVQEADLSCPIILSSENKLLDGFHRVAKALLAGQDHLPARRFREDPAPDDVKDMVDWLQATYHGQHRPARLQGGPPQASGGCPSAPSNS